MSAYTLPGYIPLNRSLNSVFERTARVQTHAPNTEGLVAGLVKSTLDYVMYSLENDDLEESELEQVVSKNLKSLETVLCADRELEVYRALVKDTKDEYKSTEESELTLDTLDEYRDVDTPSFDVKIADKYEEVKQYRDTFKETVTSNESYHLVHLILFVIANPEDPLPDDDNDDELNVSGGKISLKDPLSLNYFRHPVYSAKCKHTYEKESISTHFNSGNKHCPIDGCSAEIDKKDLKVDQIMSVRVKAYLRKEKSRKRENVTRLV